MNLDTPVEIAPGVIKTLGDCDRADLEAASAIQDAKAAHHRSQSQRLSNGLAPKCDWRQSDGSYCDLDSQLIRIALVADSDAPTAMCLGHAQQSGVPADALEPVVSKQ